LEVALHRPAARADIPRLDELLHPSFIEFGRSGRSYTKADMLRELPLAQPSDGIWSQDFAVNEITEDVALLTYRSAHVDGNGELSRHTLRSSLWQRAESGWQLRFHQGTPTDAFAKTVL
jgi:hypothetical protein